MFSDIPEKIACAFYITCTCKHSLMLQPENAVYAGKSIIVHINAAYIPKFPFLKCHKFSIHQSIDSSIHQIMVVSISISSLGCFQPGKSRGIIKYDCSTHIHGSKLHATRITSHVWWFALRNGLDMSGANPNINSYLASKEG